MRGIFLLAAKAGIRRNTPRQRQKRKNMGHKGHEGHEDFRYHDVIPAPVPKRVARGTALKMPESIVQIDEWTPACAGVTEKNFNREGAKRRRSG